MKCHGEQGYLRLLRDIMELGEDRSDRTGVGTRSIFGSGLIFDLAEGFPLLTTKKMDLKSVASELLWFVEGSDSERRLAEIRFGKPREEIPHLNTIWAENMRAPYWIDKQQFDGDLGRVYGVQWRHWTNRHGVETDQLAVLIDGLKNDPAGRRHLLHNWNPGELDEMALPACHVLSQYYVTNDGRLNCQWYQRSCDTFLGVPYNIASYALLTHILAAVCNLTPGHLHFCGGDVHIYKNHFDAVEELLTREPLPPPTLSVRRGPQKTIDQFVLDDFILSNYNPHPAISASMAV